MAKDDDVGSFRLFDRPADIMKVNFPILNLWFWKIVVGPIARGNAWERLGKRMVPEAGADNEPGAERKQRGPGDRRERQKVGGVAIHGKSDCATEPMWEVDPAWREQHIAPIDIDFVNGRPDTR